MKKFLLKLLQAKREAGKLSFFEWLERKNKIKSCNAELAKFNQAEIEFVTIKHYSELLKIANRQQELLQK